MVEAEVMGMVAAGGMCGLVTRAQALKFLTARQIKGRVRTGAWVRIFPRVYRVEGAPSTWRQSIQALLLWGGKGAVLSHRTAAALHGFKGFAEGPLELTSLRQLRVPNNVRLFRVTAMSARDRTKVDDLSVTTPTRTLLDLAALNDGYTLRSAMDQLLREKKTTVEKLLAAVKRSVHRVGVVDMRQVLREFAGEGGPTESELERCALELIQAAGIPLPKVQWGMVVGRKQRRLDLFFATQGVVIEVDGYAWHAGVDDFEEDRARNNSLILANLRVFHWTWQAIHERPEELIGELLVALNSH